MSDLLTVRGVTKAHAGMPVLRGIGSQRVPHISDYQKLRVGELREAYGIHIAAISPGESPSTSLIWVRSAGTWPKVGSTASQCPT